MSVIVTSRMVMARGLWSIGSWGIVKITSKWEATDVSLSKVWIYCVCDLIQLHGTFLLGSSVSWPVLVCVTTLNSSINHVLKISLCINFIFNVFLLLKFLKVLESSSLPPTPNLSYLSFWKPWTQWQMTWVDFLPIPLLLKLSELYKSIMLASCCSWSERHSREKMVSLWKSWLLSFPISASPWCFSVFNL